MRILTAMSAWEDYRATRSTSASTVVGDLRVLPRVPGPGPGTTRDILVHLPERALETGRRYPVLYLHDGQNLFDAATSFAGEWRVDETLTDLAAEGLEVIAVGIPNGGDLRVPEYTPYRGRPGPWPEGGSGRRYVRWLAEAVKPAVDATFPTRPEREATAIMGSSLGGLISLWAAVEQGWTFGRIGAMSPALLSGQGAILPRLRRLDPRPVRVYLDVGGREGSMAPTIVEANQWSRAYRRDARRVRDALVASGLHEPDDLRLVEDPSAIHHEAAWAQRLPDALRFLFGDLAGPRA